MSLRVWNLGPHWDNLQTSPAPSPPPSPPPDPSELRLPVGDPSPSTLQTWYESGGNAAPSLSASHTIRDTYAWKWAWALRGGRRGGAGRWGGATGGRTSSWEPGEDLMSGAVVHEDD